MFTSLFGGVSALAALFGGSPVLSAIAGAAGVATEMNLIPWLTRARRALHAARIARNALRKRRSDKQPVEHVQSSGEVPRRRQDAFGEGL